MRKSKHNKQARTSRANRRGAPKAAANASGGKSNGSGSRASGNAGGSGDNKNSVSSRNAGGNSSSKTSVNNGNNTSNEPPVTSETRIVLEARDVIKDLGEGAGQVRALKGVNLSLRAGELTLLMGPSGSGKTTLLSILGCILSPTEGQVLLAGDTTKGKDAEELAVLRRHHIGFVFQSYNLFPTLSAEENVRIALDVRGDDPREAIAKSREALKLVGLGHRMKSHPKNLSGGEQQRVAVARAVAGQPSVILADEPTAALDSENGQSVMALLAEIAQDKSRAVLAVTHDPRTLPYADRIVRIEDGLIVSEEQSNPADVATVANIRKRKRKAHV